MPDPQYERHLLALLSQLGELGYSFTTVTPATHRRVVARREQARDLRDVFGWNLPFSPELLPTSLLEIVWSADIADRTSAGLLKSRLRVASVEEKLFLHSAFPTEADDAVFFGPDTYRFARMLAQELPRVGHVSRMVDLGTGSGAGAIVAAKLLPGTRVTIADVNPTALQLAAVNGIHAGVHLEVVEGAGLDAVRGAVDLVIANPPYIMDEDDRTYRSGGAMYGAQLSIDWAIAAAKRLPPGGHMLLYSGVAVVRGHDVLLDTLKRELPALGCALRYAELDPDIFGEELERRAYQDVERIAAVGAVIRKL